MYGPAMLLPLKEGEFKGEVDAFSGVDDESVGDNGNARRGSLLGLMASTRKLSGSRLSLRSSSPNKSEPEPPCGDNTGEEVSKSC